MKQPKPLTYIQAYVYNVDDDLVVRSSPNGSATGKLLPVAEKVTVYETSNGWSRIRTNQWVSTHIFIRKKFLKSDSIALVEQIRVVDKKRLVKYLGKISNNDMKKISNSIIKELGIT